MSTPNDFTVRVRGDRDIIISKPEAGFEVTYRREMYSPMLVAADVLRSDFDESKVALLAQAWKLALSKAKSLGWLDGPLAATRACDGQQVHTTALRELLATFFNTCSSTR